MNREAQEHSSHKDEGKAGCLDTVMEGAFMAVDDLFASTFTTK